MRVDIVLISTFVLVPSLVLPLIITFRREERLPRPLRRPMPIRTGICMKLKSPALRQIREMSKQCGDSRKSVGGIVRLACL